MDTDSNSAIFVKQKDYDQLISLIAKEDSAAAEALEEELARAEVVKATAFPGDAVSMNARVTFQDLDSGEQTQVRLVFPHEANVTEMKISVLSPVGSALVGLRVGDAIDWPLGNGRVRRLRVTAVEQPEEQD